MAPEPADLPPLPRSDPTERVLGPVRGYYLASYAAEFADGYIAYCKVCADRPDNYWEATTRWKCSSRVAFPSPQGALQEAERLALARIQALLKRGPAGRGRE